MLTSKLDKAPTKSELEKKVEAWKTVNSVLVEANSKFMQGLKNLLDKEVAKQEELQKVLEGGNCSEDDNFEYVFTCGRVDMLKEILGQHKFE